MGLLPAHTADKLKFGIGPATRSGGLTDNTNRLSSSHGIVNVTADRVSKAKRYSDYIKNYEFETMKVFEFGNDSETQLNKMTRPDQNVSRINSESQINPESRINTENRFNLDSRINSPI